MKRLILVATVVLAASFAGEAAAQNYTRSTRSPSVIRPIGYEGHWSGYQGGGAGCGCATPAFAGPASCCGPVVGCSPCHPCAAKLLCIVPNAVRRFGRALDCLLPCNTGCNIGCASACGPSCATGCSSCSGGVPALSDPFMDDPGQTFTPPTPAKDVRRSPIRSSPTASRPAPVNRYVSEPQQIQVASRSMRPIGSGMSKTAATRSRESSVLKRTSHETEVTSPKVVQAHVISDYEETAAPAAPAIRPSQPRLLDMDVPVNPLR